jgi:T5SS/PEP-CTERM-associated repeat protein
LFLRALAAGLSLLAPLSPVRAALTATGDVSPSDPTTWNTSTTGYIGNTSAGSLTVDNGSGLASNYGYLGYSSGSVGVATVDGTGSTWTDSGNFYVGYSGNGTLNITNGGAVTVTGTTYVAPNTGSTGTINFGSSGGTLTTQTLYASPSQMTGTGTINACGLVSDVDLTFDSAHPLKQTIALNSSPSQTVMLNLDMTGGNSDLGVGLTGNGTLTIRDGITVSSSDGYVGYGLGSTGTVSVDGTGSTWTNSYLYVGLDGSGMLNITNGGTVHTTFLAALGQGGAPPNSTGTVTVAGAGSKWINNGNLYVGNFGSGTLSITNGGTVTNTNGYVGFFNNGAAWLGAAWLGLVTVDGIASKWTNNGTLYVGNYGSGMLSITNGGAITDTTGYIGNHSVGPNTVTVDGAGSTWTNSSSLIIGENSYYNTAINITGGAAVTAATVYLAWEDFSPPLLAIDVGRGSSLNVGNGTFANDSIVRFLAGAGVAKGNVYTPVTATTWGGSGSYQALGGTWDNTKHQFTVSAAQTGTAGTPVSIDLDNEQRVLVSDGKTGWSVGASFLASTTSKPLSLTATTIGGSTFVSLQSLLAPQQSVLGGWEFAFSSGYTAGDPAYLSFGIGSGYSRNGLEVWHYDGSNWTPFAANDLTYDGTYASFTVTGFSGYAVTTVPEPSTFALLGIGAVSLLAYAWRRRRTA